MFRLKKFVAIMIVALAATFCAPQALAGDMQFPRAGGDTQFPGVVGETPTPGANGEIQNGVTGEISFPGVNGEMGFPVAAGMWALITGLF